MSDTDRLRARLREWFHNHEEQCSHDHDAWYCTLMADDFIEDFPALAAAEAAPPKKKWPTDDELAAVTYHEWVEPRAAEAAPLDAWNERNAPDREADAFRAGLATGRAEAAPLDVEQKLWDQWTPGEKLAYGVGFRRGALAALRSPDTETAE